MGKILLFAVYEGVSGICFFSNDEITTLTHQMYCLTRRMRWCGWRKCDMTEVFYYTSWVSHRYDNLKHFTFIILIGWIIAFANICIHTYSIEISLLKYACCTVGHWEWKRTDREWMASVRNSNTPIGEPIFELFEIIVSVCQPPKTNLMHICIGTILLIRIIEERRGRKVRGCISWGHTQV